jgi:predicted RNA-binding protein YlqC (UPF0109 family)
MTELLMIIAKGLVDDHDNVQVTRDNHDENGEVVYHLTVAPDDMGKVIGKQGKIARAIRTVMRAGAGRVGEKVRVEIDG